MITLKLNMYSKTEIGTLIHILRTASESLEGAPDTVHNVKDDIDSALYYAISYLIEHATKQARAGLLAEENPE